MNTRDLTPELLSVLQSIADHGEVSAEVLAKLEAQSGTHQKYVDNLCRLLVEANKSSVSLLNAAARARHEAQKYDKSIGQFRQELVRVVDASGVKEVVTDSYSVCVCMSPPAQIAVQYLVDICSADERFIEYHREWNLGALIAAYRKGEQLPKGVTVSRVRYPKISNRQP